MVFLEVEIGGLRYSNPSMLASGILGVSEGLLRRVLEAGAGAVVTKSVTLKPRAGNPTPCFVELEVGYVNSLGIPNPGYREFLQEIKDLHEKEKIIISLAGSSVEDFEVMARAVEESGFPVVELNFSCPHAKNLGLEILKRHQILFEAIKVIKETTRLKVWVKLGLSDNLLEIARGIEKAGADAIVAINTIRCLLIDIYARKPCLSSIYGGLSGKAIHPIATRCVYDLYKVVDIPIIGVGGIESWREAVEFILAGATAFQIGSGIAKEGLDIFKKVIDGLARYLKDNGFSSVYDIVGLAHK
ncbi:MAG TPA: dihydroorotate dehydrogenase [Thermoprotei archaeon]|nr:dihydroorotate dehydrogenase [Thermoprotei archaeon]